MNNTKQINFEGMYVSEALEGLFIERNQTLILTVEPKEKTDELLITSSSFSQRTDGKFSMEIIFPETKEDNSEPAKDYALLAKQIADLMANPDCPTDLYNAMADQVTYYSNFLDHESTEMIEKSLIAWSESGEPEADITSGGGISAIV
jgi:hypothetical protein